jgi:anti-sigma regulatory factor (Ser/Thr protein kinase)
MDPTLEELGDIRTAVSEAVTNCIVHATQEKRVVVQGLDGYIVAECDDTLLICRLSDEQRIKQFSENK